MKINIKFSCVVPVQNTEKYLHECINSLTSQSYPNLEILLVDDGSIERSSRICDEFSRMDSRIRVFHTEKISAGEALNVGINNATGDYILFVDSDDFLVLSSIEKFATILDMQPEIDIIAADYIILDGEKEYFMKFSTILDNIPLNGMDFLKFQLKNRTMLTAFGHHIVKRSLILENELFFSKDIAGGEDEDWYPRVYMKAMNVITANYPHYYHRKGHTSLTNPLNPMPFSTGLILICFELQAIYNEIQDKELRLLLMDCLMHLYLTACYQARFTIKKHKIMLNTQFLNCKVYFFGTKTKILLFKCSPKLFCIMYEMYEYLWKKLIKRKRR